MKTFVTLVADVRRSLGWRVAVFAVLTFASALTEGLTIAVMLPLLSIQGFGSSSADRVGSAIAAMFGWIGVPVTTTGIGLVLGGLILISAVLFVLHARLGIALQARYVGLWQMRLVDALVAANWTYLRTRRGGDFVSAITVDTGRVGSAFYQANLIVTSITYVIVQSIVAFVVAPAVAGFVVGIGALLFLVTRTLARRAVADGRALSEANADLLSRVGDIVRAFKFLKASDTGGFAAEGVRACVRRIENLSFDMNFDVQRVRAVFEYGGGLMVAGLLVLGPAWLGLDIAAIVVVVALFVRQFPKVTALRQCIQSIGTVLPSFETVVRIRDEAEAARERLPRTAEMPTREGCASVRLAGVTIERPDGGKILDEIELDIPAGRFIAVVGPSGAGKTTLVDVILGLVEPAHGHVAIDGVALTREARAAWRRSVGYIGQDPVVFDGTIFDNVRWGRTDLDDVAVREALVAAGAAMLRGGEAASLVRVGEAGVALSGGERQRIALARALAGRPRLLVLDEATSALDPEAEATVIETIRRLRGTVTVVAVAHRLWSIRDADEIIVIEHGRIVQRGGFRDLATRPGRFCDLLTLQSADTSHSTAQPQEFT